MKTRLEKIIFPMFRHYPASVVVAFALVMLPSCAKVDEELQHQLIEARATIDTKSKALESIQAQVADLQSQLSKGGSSNSGASEELTKVKARNAELESQLQQLKQQAEELAAKPAGMPKIDMDAMANKLEDDLTRKARQLRELVQKQTPNGRIDEISLKSIEYPPQLVTPFQSAITFSVISEEGKRLRLVFPVSADLGGTWNLPNAEAVQTAYQQAQNQPQTPLAATSSQRSATSNTPNAPSSSGAGMQQVDSSTFVFDWGDVKSPGASGSSSGKPIGSQPPAQGRPSAPSGNQAPPAAATPASSPAPAAVMPVERDVIIRFE